MTDEVDLTIEADDKPVEVQLETAAAAKGEPNPKEAKAPEDEAIASLKEQVEKARADSAHRLAEAQRQIEEARQRALAAETEVRTTKRDTITTVAESLVKDKEAAKRDLIAAHEAGDFAKVAEAQDRLSMANARLVEVEKGRQAIEDEIKSPPRLPEAQPVFVDEVEKLARTLSPKSANWIRQHPQFAAGRENQRMVSAHYAALAEGHSAESDEYFSYVNRQLGLERSPERQQDDSGNRAPLSAPVSRDMAQTPRRTRPNTIRLTASEVATARDLGMTVESYAKHLAALIEEGKVTRAL